MTNKTALLYTIGFSMIALIGLTACDTVKATYCTTIVPALNKACQTTPPIATLIDKNK